MTANPVRGSARAMATRETILAAAERLFAERGVEGVSNRQVSEAAGQGNNAAVGYHFGTKTDLIRALVRDRQSGVDIIRRRMLTAHADSTDLRDWVACMVRPFTEYLAEPGAPSWYARCVAQFISHPLLRDVMIEDALAAPEPRAVADGIERLLPALPPEVRAARFDMVRTLVLHTCAERERADADAATWDATATALIDAIVGLLTAPVSGRRPTP
ncbi:TetR/AcrR family transcriptional regulator [Catenuloplanes atrovinosus]|uniref:AcrR family transcriptional regulator n=1 Tax=Catenuloplanes atrovinosus TaxID=137266 RepID=A0AAE4CDQ7_9ACTN|nr:helix-turn-helix domain-containing protein [Catenuloplanes atrovinosus]MDR7277785.1 AcrR family transcriptional regulator [Catenuloplanes atrovinosus]